MNSRMCGTPFFVINGNTTLAVHVLASVIPDPYSRGAGRGRRGDMPLTTGSISNIHHQLLIHSSMICQTQSITTRLQITLLKKVTDGWLKYLAIIVSLCDKKNFHYTNWIIPQK